MKYIGLDGELIEEKDGQEQLLNFFYGTKIGRLKLKFLIQPWVSKLGGAFLSSPFSKGFIEPFIKSNGIDMREYVKKNYSSYNQFFTRRIKPGKRPINKDENVLISPCDGKVSVYEIDDKCTFDVKGTTYTVESLLRSKKLANHFKPGYAVVLRLSVDDYHRYCYIDSGVKSENHFIQGVYHTVNPIASDHYPIYKENSREYTLMKTDHFGNVIQMEVGALMVGKISNHHGYGKMRRGMEKGYFEFGGSTIILFLQKDAVDIPQELIERTKEDCETKILQGQALGRARK